MAETPHTGAPARRRGRIGLRVATALAGAGLVLAGLARPPQVRAADYSTGGVFLPLGHGARAQGLGGAGVPVVRDDAAAYWCPSNLAWLEDVAGATFMHAQIFPEVGNGYESLSYGRRFGQRLGGEDQALRPSRWALGFFFGHLGLDFEAGGWSENRLQAAAAIAFNNFTTIGAAVRWLGLANDFDGGDASGAGFDLSVSMLLSPHLFLGIVGRDVWTQVEFDTGSSETQNFSMELGLEYRDRRRGAAVAHLVLREGTLGRGNLGLEWRAWRDVLALRGGWSVETSGESRNFPSAGAGIAFSRFVFDYGATFDGEEATGVTQRVSLHVGL